MSKKYLTILYMPRQKKVINDYDQLNKIKNYLIANTPSIEVPSKMVYINNKGDKKVINTLTKTKRIASRDKTPVIGFVSTDADNYIKVKDGGKTLKSRSDKLLYNLHDVAKAKMYKFLQSSDVRKYQTKIRENKSDKSKSEYIDKLNKHKDELKKYTRFLPDEEYRTQYDTLSKFHTLQPVR